MWKVDSKCHGLRLTFFQVYLDVDTSYGSPNYGNIHVYQKALAPQGIREVNYVFEVDAERLISRIKHALQYPKSCADLQ
jgi:hypothetical protein